jgi:hypothetical protein
VWGEWDPAREYWGEEDEPIDEWAKPIIARGPRPMFEMEQVLPGSDPEASQAAVMRRTVASTSSAELIGELRMALATREDAGEVARQRAQGQPKPQLGLARVGVIDTELCEGEAIGGLGECERSEDALRGGHATQPLVEHGLDGRRCVVGEWGQRREHTT